MQIKLHSITPNAEKTIIYIARVSNPENQNNPEIAGLLRFLIKNKHWSPFEHGFATFEIKTSRAIATQILRHRSFSFQEFSQRYSESLEIESIELRRQAIKNRQSSEEVINPYTEWYLDGATQENIEASVRVEQHIDRSLELYKQLLKHDVSKETARMILPLATQTTLYMSGSIRSWIHYIQLRTKLDVQKEHRLIAEEIERQLRVELPVTFEALDQLERKNRSFMNLIETIRQYQTDQSNTEDFLEILLRTPL